MRISLNFSFFSIIVFGFDFGFVCFIVQFLHRTSPLHPCCAQASRIEPFLFVFNLIVVCACLGAVSADPFDILISETISLVCISMVGQKTAKLPPT